MATEKGGTSSDGAAKTFAVKSENSLLSQQKAYTESLKNARAKSKETSLGLKKLQYNFKSISSEIIRSKTSRSARSVVSKARREVQRLKRLRGNSEYNDEELQAAITHAQSMVRIAGKKAAHLQQEEMMKVTGSAQRGKLPIGKEDEDMKIREESEDREYGDEALREAADDEALREEELAKLAEEQAAAAQQASAGMQENMEDLSEVMAREMSAMMEELSAEMAEMMQEMAEELDLMEELTAPPAEMSPEDFKMFKLKHRIREMKEIAEADKEYLKAIFKQLQQQSAGASAGAALSGGASGGALSGGAGGALSGGASGTAIAGAGLSPSASLPSFNGTFSGISAGAAAAPVIDISC